MGTKCTLFCTNDFGLLLYTQGTPIMIFSAIERVDEGESFLNVSDLE